MKVIRDVKWCDKRVVTRTLACYNDECLQNRRLNFRKTPQQISKQFYENSSLQIKYPHIHDVMYYHFTIE